MERLAQAHRLLRQFKEGKLRGGRLVSEDEIALVKLLVEDLMPKRATCAVDGSNFASVIFDLAHEDSKWNRALGEALHSYYEKVENRQYEAAVQILENFVRECPSRWYRRHAEAEIGQRSRPDSN